MSYVVSVKSETIEYCPQLNPEKYRVFDVYDSGERKPLQDNEGLLENNYFDQLMKVIMDDFYKLLTHYPPKK
jgi:hypothetical protein